MIPKSRLDEVIAQRDRERETNKLFASLLQNAGLDASGKKLEKPAPKVDLSGYKPEEIAQAKGLVEAMLSDKLQDVEQIKTQLSEFQQRDKERADAEAKRKRTEFEQQDEAELQAALKPYKGEFKRSEVEAQVVKWDASGDPKLKNLARSSYDVILMKMKKMKDDRVSKKPKVVPKVEADSHGSELREPTNRRVRPEPGNSSDWKDHLASEAQARMTPEE